MLLSRRAAIKGLLAVGVGTVTGATVYGVGYERHCIGITDAALPVSGLPPTLDGLRIGFLTDIHHSRTVPADDVTHAVQLVMAHRPDLIVLGGDYVTFGDRAFVGPVAELLAPLEAPHGVFAILGNHDDDRDMPAALTAQRIQVLRDARTRSTYAAEPLELAGIRFWTRRVEDVARVLRDAKHNGDSAGARSAAAHRGRRRSMFPRCSPATPTAARWCCRASGRWRADLREPRGGHGLRASPHQLPPRSRGGDADAPVADLRKRRPSIRQPPSSTMPTASG